jgi:hypothetical protein
MADLDPRLADALPFEPKQQDAVLGHILSDKNFFVQVKDRIRGAWFLDGWGGKLYDSYVKFYSKYGHLPASDDEFLGWEDLFDLPPAERAKLKNTLLRCRNETANYSLDVLREGLTGWLQSRIYHQYVGESANLFNNRKFGDARKVLEKAVRELQDTYFEGIPALDYDPWRLVESIEHDTSKALTLGHPLLDRVMNPDCARGSLLPGDSTVLMAPTNVGKTTATIAVIAANILERKHCIVLTHEGRDRNLMEKVYQALIGVTPTQFRAMARSNELHLRNGLQAIYDLLKEYLTHIHIQKPGLTVEEVVSIIRSHQQRLKARTGHGYHICADDYPAILGSGGISNVRMEKHDRISYIYRYLVDLMGEEQIHGLFPIQTNRDGSKMNRQVGDYRNKKHLLTLEFVQAAYEATNSATNILTINRSPDDQAKHLITYLFCKSRSSETNVAVACRSAFHIGRAHWGSLPATMFRGTEGIDQLDSLLLEFPNQEIPFDRMHT